MIAQIETALQSGVQFVDKASMASDRWLFLAALVALLATMALVIYWLVKSLEKKAIIHAEERLEWKKDQKLSHEEHKADRKEDQKEYLTALDLFKADIREMTVEIKKNTEVLTAHDRDMRAAHAVETAIIVGAELKKLGITTPKS